MHQRTGGRQRPPSMQPPTCEYYYMNKPFNRLNSTKSKMNQTRVVDFSGIERKEEVNRVSKLSKSSAYFWSPSDSHATNRAVEATGNKRSQAHRQVLRKVKTDIEGLRKQEKVGDRQTSPGKRLLD